MQVIPIYGRGGDHQDPRKKAVKDDWNRTESVPQRPAGRRPALIQVIIGASARVLHAASDCRESETPVGLNAVHIANASFDIH